MIISTLKLKPALGKKMQVLQILYSTTERILGQSGCISCGIYQDIQDHERIIYMEEWESEKDMNRHLCSDRYMRILTAMEFAGEPPEIKFYSVASTKGIEAVHTARNGQANER
jgi:quinol monooxygenase YgiN